MRDAFRLLSLLHASPVVLTVLCMMGVVLFTILDRGLSGGSAQDPIYAMGLLAAGAVALVVLVAGPDSGLVRIGATLLGVLPALLVAASFASQAYRFANTPEQIERRAAAQNVRCAARASGVAEKDRMLLQAKTNIMSQWGDPNGKLRAEIEDRLDITILPDCRFQRGAPERAPDPASAAPEIHIEDYQPPARSETRLPG